MHQAYRVVILMFQEVKRMMEKHLGRCSKTKRKCFLQECINYRLFKYFVGMMTRMMIWINILPYYDDWLLPPSSTKCPVATNRPHPHQVQ